MKARDYFEKAFAMPYHERKDIAQRASLHPKAYTLTDGNAPGPVLMPTEKRQEIERAIVDFGRLLYGIPDETPFTTQWLGDGNTRNPLEMAGYNVYKSEPEGWPILRFDPTTWSVEYLDAAKTARFLLRLDYPCVQNATVAVKRWSNGERRAIFYLAEAPTIYVDANGRRHREQGPAYIDCVNGTAQYFYHGERVNPDVIRQPESVAAHHLVENPGFSMVGGFAGLTKLPQFKCIARGPKGEGLYQGGGQMTWWAQREVQGGRTPTGRIWTQRPAQFLYDPNGMSGWVSSNVKTIPGAQRSMLRLKLTRKGKEGPR